MHYGVWHAPITSIYGHRYFVTFIAGATRVTWMYLLNLLVFQTRIKAFRSNNGEEYTSNVFWHYLAENVIESQTSCAYTPEQNGVAKRKNRRLLEVTRALLF